MIGRSSNPLETSMLLVDFNLAEHLDPDKKTQMYRTVSWVPIVIRMLA
jgi:hypothetical protein